ncbi:hypothetical protein BG011_010186 [Mortierella polycephala]|uniref:UspA domain-containing protein n=1 Tax=Mortierella polycephala TaxID=41804 RepID=A0A9P6TVY7_9FUNG|nr:hypothetical protein BG011_010186 [Mortierella polycephala]
MIISTPKIGDLNDPTTLTLNNTLANAQISTDISYTKPMRAQSDCNSIATTTTNSSISTGSTGKDKRRALTTTDGYVGRVGFDTLSCNETSEYAFTIQAKTDGWKRTKTSRTFLVGIDSNDYSAHALEWVMENMIEDGDEIVALRVVPIELRDSLTKTGIPSFQGQESAARTEANNIMRSICEGNQPSKEISIVVEYIVGNVRDTIQHMIKLYSPDMLVVGTRGRSSVKGFLLGSISRYCLHHSSVPVIVVRPERKLNKSKNKAKGIFRRRSSVVLENDAQPTNPSISDLDLHNNQSTNNSSTALLTVQSALFPSATIHAGENFPGQRASPRQTTRPLSSLFSPILPKSPPPTTSTASPISLSAQQMHTSAKPPPPPPPPEGMIKMKKSLTTDGSLGKASGTSIGKSSGGFLSGSLSGSTLLGPLMGRGGDKEKDSNGSAKSKKRLSYNGQAKK